MREIITKIVQKHGLDLASPEAQLRLAMRGLGRLAIEKKEEHLVSVAHYHGATTELIANPKIIFFTDDTEWVPIEATRVLNGQCIYALLTPDGQDVVCLDPDRQASLAAFSEAWAKNIQVQGWLEHAEQWDSSGWSIADQKEEK